MYINISKTTLYAIAVYVIVKYTLNSEEYRIQILVNN